MQHHIPVDQFGPLTGAMADNIQRCVHCGFCLPTCPTYQVMGEEMDSPRGRIFLMKEVLEGKIDFADALPFVDRCLGCVGCVTACPSGVQYGDLLTAFRGVSESRRERSLVDRLLRWFVLETLPYPGRFRLAAQLGQVGRLFRRVLPGRLGLMLDLLPENLPAAQPLPEVYPAEGSRRARVALLAGCAQQVLGPDINWATLRVLARNGIETVIPWNQSCCGALAAHTGDLERARSFASHNIQAFPRDVDAILTNAAGCGSGMHEYALWLKGTRDENSAHEFVKQLQDVSSFLAQHGIVPPKALRRATKVAYHDACHLAHAQKVKNQPRQLLSAIGNLEIVDVPNGEICCGSAGTYNIEQPDIAKELGRQKAKSIADTGAVAVATGNIGCMTQIEAHLKQLHQPIRVWHTMQILDRAYRHEAI